MKITRRLFFSLSVILVLLEVIMGPGLRCGHELRNGGRASLETLISCYPVCIQPPTFPSNYPLSTT